MFRGQELSRRKAGTQQASQEVVAIIAERQHCGVLLCRVH
ncbi:hypothetical protein BDD21_1729 [Thiocapsa rosea]|uniref:Uncharacterized protein n=1 Tax=Thiocapsa rosea TaxID=69360 RepID=A0A495V6M0_9GAMM|nr:hypothetical protein BDD21_1729 [Thiocapsa rosea]